MKESKEVRGIKLSLVVASYNCEMYIQRCLDSIFKQTVSVGEIIVVDDGSTDGSVAMIEEIASGRENVIIYKKKNEGTFLSRIDGMKMATGDYVGFIDSDDILPEKAVEILLSAARRTDADIIEGNCDWFADEEQYGREAKRMEVLTKRSWVNYSGYVNTRKMLYDYFRRRHGQPLWKKIVKTDCIRQALSDVESIPDYRKKYKGIRNEDSFITPTFLINAKKVFAVEDITYHYCYFSSGSITRELSQNSKEMKSYYARKQMLLCEYIRWLVERKHVRDKKLLSACEEFQFSCLKALWNQAHKEKIYRDRYSLWKNYEIGFQKREVLRLVWRHAKGKEYLILFGVVIC